MSVVKTNPALVTENVIQATADVPDLTLRPFSDAQASPIMRVQNAAGSADNLVINADGSLHIHPATDVKGLDIDQPLGGSNTGFQVSVGGATYFELFPPGDGEIINVISPVAADIPLYIQASPSEAFVEFQQLVGGLALSIGPDVSYNVMAPTTTSFSRRQASIVPSWVDSTDATRKGRLSLLAADNASVGRVGVIVEADGAAARVGFLGAPAVVRQTGASAAAIAAIIDPNVKAAVQALQTALANLGLVTSPA